MSALHANDGSRGGKAEYEGVEALRRLLGGEAVEGDDLGRVEGGLVDDRRGLCGFGVVGSVGSDEKLAAAGNLDFVEYTGNGEGERKKSGEG